MLVQGHQIRGIGMTSQRTRERLTQLLKEMGVTDQRVLEVMRCVPRHLFMDEALSHRAYENTALPIGHGQTISQPYIVARMTEALLEGGPVGRVLDVGSGCGYQAAVLSSLVGEVYGIERIYDLVKQARRTLAGLNHRNVWLHHGDGFLGLAQQAPFDGILVAASPEHIPIPLLEQLADGGRLIIPIGDRSRQRLVRITRVGDQFQEEVLEGCRFVPMLGGIKR